MPPEDWVGVELPPGTANQCCPFSDALGMGLSHLWEISRGLIARLERF